MRMRMERSRLRKRTSILTVPQDNKKHYCSVTALAKLKQKMESRRRGKRKSPSQDIIFEVSDNDMSPESVHSDTSEPEAKISKTEDNFFEQTLFDNSNLENDGKQKSLSIAVIEDSEVDDSVIIVENDTVCTPNSSNNLKNTKTVVEIAEDVVDRPVDNPITSDTDHLKGELKDNWDTANPKTSDTDHLEGELKDNLDTASNLKDDSCICITFSNERMAELYKFKFLKFINSLVELEAETSDALTITIRRDPHLNPKDWVVVDEIMCINEDKLASPLPVTPERPQGKKKKKKIKKEKQLFILDRTPSQNETEDTSTKYSTKFQINVSKHSNDEGEVKISAQTCFNCNSNHALRDCPIPKDWAKVNAARQKHQSKKQTPRYHLEEEQKYGHLTPGNISDKLREALGLRKNQLPSFIYRMREIGYPPGWLEEAKFVHSNLAMFDSDGHNVKEANLKKTRGLDPQKIVNYPGFNVAMEKGTKDEHRHHRVPAYSENFNKEKMIEYFQKQFSKEQDDLETYDMELDTTFEETQKTNPVDVINEEKVVIENPQVKEAKEVDSSLPSPSLTDLEKQKENLLAELEDSSNTKSEGVPCEDTKKSTEISGKSSDLEKSENSQEPAETVPPHNLLTLDIEKAEGSISSPNLSPVGTVNSVKNSSFGTPILKSNSPYARLPNPDNFMKGVSPVIDFENLPNSTGKYEQMTGVLQKVRNTLKSLQNCN